MQIRIRRKYFITWSPYSPKYSQCHSLNGPWRRVIGWPLCIHRLTCIPQLLGNLWLDGMDSAHVVHQNGSNSSHSIFTDDTHQPLMNIGCVPICMSRKNWRRCRHDSCDLCSCDATILIENGSFLATVAKWEVGVYFHVTVQSMVWRVRNKIKIS